MKRLASMAGLILLAVAPAHATPTTNFWAPSTPAVQRFGVLHVTYDTYFADEALYPVDVGLTAGVLPWQAVQLELGFDLLYPTVDADGNGLVVPLYLNAKLGGPEDLAFEYQPAWAIGAWGIGIEPDVTNYNLLYAMLGKTLPYVGSLSIGGYYGLNDDLLVDADGGSEQLGLMAGWASPAVDVPTLEKLVFTADVQTGQNAFGAVGGGVGIYFTPAVSLLTGPVFFLEPAVQPGDASWMWSFQLDVDIDLRSGS